MKLNSILCIFISFVVWNPINAQTTIVEDVKISSTVAEKIGHTLPLSELIAKSATSEEKIDLSKKNRAVPDNFAGREVSKVIRPELEHQGPDPIRQWSANPLRMAGEIELEVSVDGISGRGSPHDPTGDIGKDYYLQAVNITTIAVLQKDGSEVTRFEANTIWSSIGFVSRGDPIILYDQEFDRWLITEFPPSSDLLVAVSDTQDPLGSYTAYNFSTPFFPDYPKYAIWSNAISVTTNEQGAGQLHNYFINRMDLMDTLNEVRIQRIALQGNSSTEAGFFVSTPIDWSGQIKPAEDKPMVMALNDASWGSAPEDAVDLYSFNINWNDSDSTEVVRDRIVTTPYDSYPCASETGGFACIPQFEGSGLDGLPELIMHNPHYRNFGTHESIVANWITDATDGENLSGIRWTEFRRLPGEDWSIYQEGTYAPDDGLHRFMGGIAMDSMGNIGLAFNISGPNDYVGIRVTGRRASDPLGMMTLGETNVIDGASTINSGGRFGDYSHMTIDPVDERTFWFTAEYAGSNGTRTRIVSFNLERKMVDVRAQNLESPVSASELSDEEEVRFRLINTGIDTQRIFQVGFMFENAPPIIEDVDFLLPTDSTYTHTFAQKIDLSAFGQYDLKVFSIVENDEFVQNDTIKSQINNYPLLDGSINGTSNFDRPFCREDYSEGSFIIENKGIDTIHTFSVEISLAGSPYDTVAWEGTLLFLGEINVPFEILGLVDGDNEIQIRLLEVNGEEDQILDNNTFIQLIDVNRNREEITIILTTDRFPEETSWQISTVGGFLLTSGSGFGIRNEIYEIPVCLVPGNCYVFTIFDSYGDGLEGIFGNPDGDYQILDTEGNVLASLLQPNFGFQERNTFCFGIECMLDAEVVVTDVSAGGVNDGVIMISPINGNGSVMYSIDSGATFVQSPIFENLAAGTYSVFVQDIAGCMYEEEVTVGMPTSISNLENGQEIRVFPNPTDGVFRIEVKGVEGGSVFLPLTIFDTNGKVIQHQKLARYNNTFTGMLSLYAYPDGTYFIRFLDERLKHLVRLVKQ